MCVLLLIDLQVLECVNTWQLQIPAKLLKWVAATIDSFVFTIKVSWCPFANNTLSYLGEKKKQFSRCPDLEEVCSVIPLICTVLCIVNDGTYFYCLKIIIICALLKNYMACKKYILPVHS